MNVSDDESRKEYHFIQQYFVRICKHGMCAQVHA